MQVFKVFFKIAKKRLPATLTYFIIFAVILVIMSVVAKDDNKKNFTVSSLNLCVINKDNSEAGKALIKYLSKNHKIIDLKTTDKDVLQDNLYYQTINYVLTIEKGFERKLLTGNTKNLVSHNQLFNNVSSYFAGQQVEEFISTINIYLKGGFSMDEAIAKTESALADNNVNVINFDKQNNKKSDGVFYFFQYVPYIMISILIVGMAPILIIFRKKDIDNRVNCSSLTLNSRNLQITLGCVVYGLTLWILFLLVGGITCGFNMLFSEKGILGLINSFIFLLISVSISLLLSTFSLSTNALNMAANVIGLGMSFLCGIFVPQWFLGKSVLLVSRFLPAYWYIKINNMISGFSGDTMSYSNYWTYIGIEFIFFLAIFSVYLVASKQRKNLTT